ncbi:MAG: hypothetical protein O3A45_03670 [Proteobacteria bacterium]|jgi:hypothetical protein|nr:hypothetical protein [Pseudomonadota bacterium]
MKKFIFLHYGFETPTSEIMAAWGKWFDAVKDNVVDMGGHFVNGCEITQTGIKNLPRNKESLTGYTIISAKNLEEAEKLALSNPFIFSIQIHELM